MVARPQRRLIPTDPKGMGGGSATRMRDAAEQTSAPAAAGHPETAAVPGDCKALSNQQLLRKDYSEGFHHAGRPGTGAPGFLGS